MGLFSKKHDKHLVRLNEQLDQLHTDKQAAELTRQQAQTRVDGGNLGDEAMNALRNAVDRIGMLDDRIVAKTGEIEEVQAKLAAEEAAAVRAQAAEKLGYTVENLAIAATNTERPIADALDAMKVALDRLPASFDFNPVMTASNIASMVTALRSEMQRCLSYGRICVDQIRVGDRPIPAPPPEPIAVAPAYAGEYKTVLLLRPGKCVLDGVLQTYGRHRMVSLPVAIADAAIKHGHATLPDSDVAKSELQRDMGGADYAYQPENICADLMQPHKEVRYIDEKNRQPNLHSATDAYQADQRASGWVHGGERVGTIAVSRPR